jgi:hypothetical protein
MAPPDDEGGKEYHQLGNLQSSADFGIANRVANGRTIDERPRAFAESRYEIEFENSINSRAKSYDYRERTGTVLASSASLDRRSAFTRPPPSLERQQRLAEQGWVEKFGRNGSGFKGKTSWKIERIMPGGPRQASKLKADKHASHREINEEFQVSEEKKRLMAELAEKNSQDVDFKIVSRRHSPSTMARRSRLTQLRWIQWTMIPTST